MGSLVCSSSKRQAEQFRDFRIVEPVSFGRSERERDTEPGGGLDETCCDIIRIAHVGEPDALEFAEPFLDREHVGNCLAGMGFVREGVDDGTTRVPGQFDDGLVPECPDRDAIDHRREDS